MTTPNPSRSVSPEPTKGERVEQIRERVRVATPGPWVANDYGPGWWAVLQGAWDVSRNRASEPGVIADAHYSAMTDDENAANAELIAHAPTDIMFLLDQLAAYIPLVEAAEALAQENADRHAEEHWVTGEYAPNSDCSLCALEAALVQVPGQQQADTGGG